MFEKVKKFIRLLLGGILYNPKLFFLYIKSFFAETKIQDIKTLKEDVIINDIVNGKSVIRIGDGEALLLVGRHIYFQKTSRKLSTAIQKIITDYSERSPYLLGIPTNKLTKTEQELENQKQVRLWRLYRAIFPALFSTQPAYIPLTFFYTKGTFENEVAPLLQNRHIICVSNSEVLDQPLRNYMDGTFLHTSYVVTPAQEAFKQKDNLMVEIKKCLSKHPNTQATLLLAAGPVTKVIAYELSLKGIQCLDVGQGMKLIAHDLDRSHKI